MAKSKPETETEVLFTDAELIAGWKKAATDKLTRHELVTHLISLKNKEDDKTTHDSFYAKVNARYAALKKRGLKWPKIPRSPRGSKTDGAKIKEFQGLFEGLELEE